MRVVITACMNRFDDLSRVLPTWLSAPVDKVIIADFSSEESVAIGLQRAGLLEEKIQVVRFEGAQRWVLSWAYNSLLSCIHDDDLVLKVDCDDSFSPDLINGFNCIFDSVSYKCIIRGNWRLQQKYPSLNYPSSGFFACKGSSLLEIGGFNPCVLTYGWDDIDLYSRFSAAGHKLIDAPPGILVSPSHGSTKRFGNQFSEEYLCQWDLGQKRTRAWDLREISNCFNKSVAQIMLHHGVKSDFNDFDWDSKLSAIGTALLSQGIDFTSLYDREFSDKIDLETYRQFVRNSLYFNALQCCSTY